MFATISTGKFSISRPPVSKKMKLRHLRKSASCFHNCIVFTNITFQVRDRDLDQLFRHENSAFSPAPKSQFTTWNRVRPTSICRGNISFTRCFCNSWLCYLRWSSCWNQMECWRSKSTQILYLLLCLNSNFWFGMPIFKTHQNYLLDQRDFF